MNAAEAIPQSFVPVRASTCRHCGAVAPEQAEFCCAGCAYVFRLVQEAGWQAYYEIKDAVTAPADTALLPARDHTWLAVAQQKAEARATDGGAGDPGLVVDVQGISCAGCVWLIEKIFDRQRGAGRIDVNAQTGQARMQWMRGQFDAPAFAAELQRFNYLLGPASSNAPVTSESRALAKRIGLCAAFAMNVMLFTLPTYFGMERTFAYADLFGTLSMVFGTLSLLAGGGFFLARAWRALAERAMHIDLPIALGIVGAYVGSTYGWLAGREAYVYFDFVSAFILLMLIGRWAQTVAIERNQRRLLAHQPAAPTVITRNASGETVDAAPDGLGIGQAYAIRAGHTTPVESRLETDEATLSLAWINGEAEPRMFRRGQRVPAGAQNLSRREINLLAVETWDQSMLAGLLAPVGRDQFRHRLLERVIQGYLIAIIAAAVLAGAAWWWTTQDAARTGAVVVAILVVSCPCALGLAFPLCDEMAAVALRRRGVFVRRADLWPKLDEVEQVVFDKTGTLTLEYPQLENPEVLRALDAEARAALATLVSDTPHPICRTLHEQLLASGAVEPLAGYVEEIVGCGVALDRWRLGQESWATGGAPDARAPEPVTAAGEARRDTVLAWSGAVVARFRLRDTPRSDAARELAALRARGLETFILSGDRSEKVGALARDLGLPEGHAISECSPHDKAAWLQQHCGASGTMMLGDGANDSLAFDRALCRGTPVTHRGVLEKKADFYYLGRGIGGIRALFEVNDARRRTQRGLLAFMILYNVIAVGLAVTGHMNPLLAAILMPVSSLLTLAMVGLGMRGVFRLEAVPERR